MISSDQEAMEEQEGFPEKTDDFLHWLHRYWPHRCPDQGQSLEAIHRYSGARGLIDMLMYRAFGTDQTTW